MFALKKSLLGAATVLPLFLATLIAVPAVPVQAQERVQHSEQTYNDARKHMERRHSRRDHRRGRISTGEAIGLGIVGLALGAILADTDRDRYYDRRYREDYYRDRRHPRWRERHRTCFEEQIVWRDYRGRRRVDYEYRCR